MARKQQQRSGRSVMIVDDNAEYLLSARAVIAHDGHEVLTVGSASEALAILKTREVDLVLVDYIMPGMGGGDFVRALRTFRPRTQVILQTGYASEHPPRVLLRELDIQGFHDKSDGPEKLSLWIDVGLKAAYTVQLLAQSRAGLRYILDATPALHRIQPLEDLLQGILLQTSGLLGAANAFVAAGTPPAGQTPLDDGFLAMAQDGGDLSLRAATGRFRVALRVDESLDPARLAQVAAALKAPGVTTLDGVTIAPLRIGAEAIGVVYLDRAVSEQWETELVEVFANQAAVAIQNVSLYEMAALDTLTHVATRRFFDLSLARELRGASRTGAPVGLVVVDVDEMKLINDGHGHGAGDLALAEIGRRLRKAIRVTDIAGRIGGDEFAVVLPCTDPVGAAIVVERMRRALAAMTIEVDGRAVPISASVGAAVLEGAFDPKTDRSRIVSVLETASRRLLAAADAAMYAHKRTQVGAGGVGRVPWPTGSESPPEPKIDTSPPAVADPKSPST